MNWPLMISNPDSMEILWPIS